MMLGIMDKYEYYYRNVYMDSVRALDFVCQREEIDADKIGVMGWSQGGGITLVVAGLDKRPKFAMTVYPFLCHFKHSFEMYQEGPYAEFYDYFRRVDPEMKTSNEVFETLSYFDVMNMASRINCPVMMTVGLRDLICPPSSTYATYNHLNCKKEIKIYPNYGHEAIPFHDEAMYEYAARFL